MKRRKCFLMIVAILLIVTNCGAKLPPADAKNTRSPARPSETLPAASTPSPAPLSPTATTYYVATSGNDEDNDGSEAHPWQTIQHAVEQLTPGDTVLVKSGTYVGARLENSGTAVGPLH